MLVMLTVPVVDIVLRDRALVSRAGGAEGSNTTFNSSCAPRALSLEPGRNVTKPPTPKNDTCLKLEMTSCGEAIDDWLSSIAFSVTAYAVNASNSIGSNLSRRTERETHTSVRVHTHTHPWLNAIHEFSIANGRLTLQILR